MSDTRSIRTSRVKFRLRWSRSIPARSADRVTARYIAPVSRNRQPSRVGQETSHRALPRPRRAVDRHHVPHRPPASPVAGSRDHMDRSPAGRQPRRLGLVIIAISPLENPRIARGGVGPRRTASLISPASRRALPQFRLPKPSTRRGPAAVVARRIRSPGRASTETSGSPKRQQRNTSRPSMIL